MQKSRPRCVVCCSICLSKTSPKPLHKYRAGYQTSGFCVTCGIEAANVVKELRSGKEVTSDISPPLCNVARFVSRGETRTCEEIHHSGEPYPSLDCCVDQTGAEFNSKSPSLQVKKRSRLLPHACASSSSGSSAGTSGSSNVMGQKRKARLTTQSRAGVAVTNEGGSGEDLISPAVPRTRSRIALQAQQTKKRESKMSKAKKRKR